jgi:hypothetical protein
MPIFTGDQDNFAGMLFAGETNFPATLTPWIMLCHAEIRINEMLAGTGKATGEKLILSSTEY